MILLDTNVVSEPMRSKPEPNVLAWLDAQTAESIYLSTVSLAELLLGIESLPVGKRRKALAAALDEQIIAPFGERIVPFDLGAAGTYAKIVRRACQHRHPISVADDQIAAIAASCKFSVATRDETPVPGRRDSGHQPLDREARDSTGRSAAAPDPTLTAAYAQQFSKAQLIACFGW